MRRFLDWLYEYRAGRRAEKRLWKPTPEEARRVEAELRRRLEDS